MPTYTLGALADLLGARVAGDPQLQIKGVATIENAGPGEITFLANLKYAPKVKATKASAILESASSGG